MWNIFSCTCWPSVCSLWRNITLDLLLMLWLDFFLLSGTSGLYILEIKLLLVISVTNVFSQLIGYLFILFMVFFAVPKLMHLIRSHLFISPFISIALGDWAKKTFLQFISDNVLPMFSSRSFIMPCLKSLSHLGFIFCVLLVGRGVLTLLIYMCLSAFPTQLAEETLFTIVYSWLLCWILIDHTCVGLFLYSLFCFIDPLLCWYIQWYICLCQYQAVSINCGFVVLPEAWDGYASKKNPESFMITYKLYGIICSNSVKNSMGNLIGITLNLGIILAIMAILTTWDIFSISLNHLPFPLSVFYSSQHISLSPP